MSRAEMNEMANRSSSVPDSKRLLRTSGSVAAQAHGQQQQVGGLTLPVKGAFALLKSANEPVFRCVMFRTNSPAHSCI